MGVGRLTDALREHFAPDQIFQDISSIDPGADFIEALQQALAYCAAVLVVIGPKWLSAVDRQGRRRLDDADDWVRQEIVEALGRPGLRVFPLLVDGAEMPAGAELPDAIRPLARRQAYELTLRHWAKDIAVLVETLKKIPSLVTQGSPPKGATALYGPAFLDTGLPGTTLPEVESAPARPADVSQPPAASPEPSTEAPLAEVSAPPVERQEVGQQPEEPPLQRKTGGAPNRRTESSSASKGLALAGVAFTLGFGLWFVSGKKSDPPVVAPLAVEAPQNPVSPEPAAAKAVPLAQPVKVSKPVSAAFTGEMVLLPAGCFEMGSPPDEKDRYDNERQYRVCVETFAIGKTEVTQAQWQSVMGTNPSEFKCADCPVRQVSWTDANAFIAKLNAEPGQRYRLPTEAEWEYACRGGRPGERYCGGDNPDSVASTSDNSGGHTHPVGQKGANGFGLHDMSGNVWEWTCSGYDKDNQGGEGKCAKNAGFYVARGGACINVPRFARSANRLRNNPGNSGSDQGFRLARTLP